MVIIYLIFLLKSLKIKRETYVEAQYIQSVIQITPEISKIDLLVEPPVGGGNESYPKVFAPFGGFADNTPIKDGYTSLTESPGIGFEKKADLINLFYDLF